MRGIAFENSGVAAARAEAFLPGESVRRLSVRAFDDAGNLLPGRTVLDLAGNRATGQLGALEFKLHEGVSLTARQAEHFPYLSKNGGVIVGRNGEILGLRAGSLIGPLIAVELTRRQASRGLLTNSSATAFGTRSHLLFDKLNTRLARELRIDGGDFHLQSEVFRDSSLRTVARNTSGSVGTDALLTHRIDPFYARVFVDCPR